MAVLATDDFNRADSGSMGANWTTVTDVGLLDPSGFNIVSNSARPNSLGTDAAEMYTGVAFPADQYAQARLTMTGTPADSGPGVMVRSTSAVARSRNSWDLLLDNLDPGRD